MKLYLAIGHGIEPSGTYDPGAVYHDLVEHDLATTVVEHAVKALHRSGFRDFAWETSAPGHVDPDFVETVVHANAAKAQYVIEVHFNASGSDGLGHGSLTCYRPGNDETVRLAKVVNMHLAAAVGLGDNGLQARTNLYLLNSAHGHAIIPEVAFVDGDHDELVAHPEILARAGEAIAEGFLAVIGHPYVAPGTPAYVVHDAKTDKTTRWANLEAALEAVRHGLHGHDGPVTIHRESR